MTPIKAVLNNHKFGDGIMLREYDVLCFVANKSEAIEDVAELLPHISEKCRYRTLQSFLHHREIEVSDLLSHESMKAHKQDIMQLYTQKSDLAVEEVTLLMTNPEICFRRRFL